MMSFVLSSHQSFSFCKLYKCSVHYGQLFFECLLMRDGFLRLGYQAAFAQSHKRF